MESQFWQEFLCSSMRSYSLAHSCFLGFIKGIILMEFDPTVSSEEMVNFVRKGDMDIEVFNIKNVLVGRLHANLSKILSPLIDAKSILIEGTVNNPRNSIKYRMECLIHIYATVESTPDVKSALSQGKLELIPEVNYDDFLEEETWGILKLKWARPQEFKNIDDIYKLVDANVSKKWSVEALEPPRDVIKTELFVHQKEELGWLVHRENSSELPPFWKKINNGVYENALTNFRTNICPETLQGGIFANGLGLGKRLTLLALISMDKCDGSVLPRERRTSETSPRSQKRGKDKNTHLDKNVKGKSVCIPDESSVDSATKNTLIVCPRSLFSVWKTQISMHTMPEKLKVYIYGMNDNTDLKTYDIVLTAYSTLVNQLGWEDSPVKKIVWWRVILDEGNIINQMNTAKRRAVIDIEAKQRWVLPGKSIQNVMIYLHYFMAFLHLEPFSSKSYWQRLIERPINLGDREGVSRLKVLMASISLRRTKDKGLIGLPPKTVETHYVQLSREERELYDKMEAEAKDFVQQCMNDDFLMHNYSNLLGMILRLRLICDDIDLCPSDLESLLHWKDIEDVSNNPELLKKLLTALQDDEKNLKCPICLSSPTDRVITSCAHIFCQACILTYLQKTNARCPLCRSTLSKFELFSASEESYNTDKTGRKSASSKTAALISLLLASRDQNPSTKIVVFSEFRKMLTRLELALKAVGFNILRLDESMTKQKRAHVIEEFGALEPDTPTILLANFTTSCDGINLTAASQMYLFEPCWYPLIEEYSMDRIHRIGQKQKVEIIRLIAGNSIEEIILECREMIKKLLMRGDFCRKGPKEIRDFIARLFSF